MNWLDVGVLVLIVSSAVSGLVRGLLRELAGLLGLMAGLYVALRYHQALALAVDAHHGGAAWARTLAFVVIVIACWIAGELVGFFAGKTIDLTGAKWLDRIIGAVFGAARGFVVAGMILLLVDHYFGESKVPVRASTLGRPAVATAEALGGRIWSQLRTSDPAPPHGGAGRVVRGGPPGTAPAAVHGKDTRKL